MSKLMVAMKEEIRRLARKEIRTAIGGLKKDRVTLKRTVTDLKKLMKAERKTVAALSEAVSRQSSRLGAPAEGQGRVRITGRGVRALRRKLKLSQAEFGKLIGVNGITVMKWEHQSGPLKMREKSRQAYLSIRDIGAKEANLRLGR